MQPVVETRLRVHEGAESMPSILVVQNKNIGDLVLATPFIGQLHRECPDAAIHVVANEYNAPVLDGNPHIARIYLHAKLKHHADEHSALAVRWRAVRLLYQLKRVRYDHVFLLSGSDTPRYFRLANLIGPNHIISCPRERSCSAIDGNGRRSVDSANMHLARRSLHLLQHAFPYHRRALASPATAPCRVYPAREAQTRWLARLCGRGLNPRRRCLADQREATTATLARGEICPAGKKDNSRARCPGAAALVPRCARYPDKPWRRRQSTCGPRIM